MPRCCRWPGQVLARTHPGADTLPLSSCIVGGAAGHDRHRSRCRPGAATEGTAARSFSSSCWRCCRCAACCSRCSPRTPGPSWQSRCSMAWRPGILRRRRGRHRRRPDAWHRATNLALGLVCAVGRHWRQPEQPDLGLCRRVVRLPVRVPLSRGHRPRRAHLLCRPDAERPRTPGNRGRPRRTAQFPSSTGCGSTIEAENSHLLDPDFVSRPQSAKNRTSAGSVTPYEIQFRPGLIRDSAPFRPKNCGFLVS